MEQSAAVQLLAMPPGPRFAAVSAALNEALAASSAADGWSPEDRRLALDAVDRATGTLTALRARLLAAEQAAGTWALHGDRSLAAWRSRTSRQGAGAGVSQVRQAEALTTLPRVAEALTAGAVTATHVEAIARLAGAASPAVARRVASEEGQRHLVELAERLDATAYTKALARWQAELEPVARQRAHDEQQAARHLHLSHTPGGTVVKGLVDTVAGHRLQLALEAVSPRPALDDDRSSEQRRADALLALADRALEDPATVTGAAIRPHVSLVVSESTWTALRTPPSRPSATPGGALHVAAALVDQQPVCDEDGKPWPPSEVARVLCDCRLTRVVLGTDSVPLDVGRSHRLFTGAQRRAAIVRDGGCAWPSCPAAARWCELHHIRWWDRDGGSSDLENAVLLCVYHHHLVHRRDLTITRRRPQPRDRADRRNAGYEFTTADGRILAAPPSRGAPEAASPSRGSPQSAPPSRGAPEAALPEHTTRPPGRDDGSRREPRVRPRGHPAEPMLWG